MKSAFLNETQTKKELADFICKSNKLSMDIYCKDFEREFALWQRSEFALLFNSGGSANLAILQALKNLGRLKDGSRVGYSCLTWSTNVMPILQMGMTPVPVDCSVGTLNIMRQNVEEAHNDVGLDAMFITNALGFSGDLSDISEYCKGNQIVLIEDNCEALGAEQGSRLTGNYGVASSFSFFVAHHLSTIEGGMVVTEDEELRDMLMMVRANGWDRNLEQEKQLAIRKKFNIESEFESKYRFYELGFNFRPTEITGFLGLRQLQYLEWNIKTRIENHKRLASAASKNSELTEVDYSHMDRPSPFGFPVICKSEALRKKYIERFQDQGVEIRPMIAGNMQSQPFYSKYNLMLRDTPGAEELDKCSFYCGNYPELTEEDLLVIEKCVHP